MAAPQSTPLPVAPQRNEAEAEFTEKANAFVAALEPFRQEVQAQADYVETELADLDAAVDQAVADATQAAADSADAAATSESNAAGSESTALGYRNEAEVFKNETENARDAALALVNFVGKWEDLIGALNTPATVYHLGSYWNLLTDLADVTLSEPSNDNADWLFVYTNAELRRSLLDEATLYADFENGDYRLYEGVGSGVVRNKAFADVFTFTRGSSATGFGVSTLETVTTDVARFVYSPELRKRQGLQIEESRTNLLLRSEEFISEIWGKTGITVSGSTLTATTDNVAMRQNLAGGANTYVLSGRIRKSIGSSIRLELNGQTSLRVTLNLDALTFGGIGSSITETSAVNLANGDIFFYIVGSVNYAGSNGPAVTLINSGDELIVRELQTEVGTFPTSYTKTEATTVTRASDSCSRTLGTEFNASEGTLLVVAKGRSGETLLTLGGESIVSDENVAKPYAITYDSDPSATTLDLGNGLFSLAAYIPRKFTPAELEVIIQPEAQ